MTGPAEETAFLQAGCVAAEGRGLLILGAPGTGKSSLALDLIALGATLVADDGVRLARRGEALEARAAGAPGLIEARGIGLLRLPRAGTATVALAVDLDRAEPERLPPRRSARLLGVPVPLVLAPAALRPAALWAALLHGPPLDPDAPREDRRR